MISLTESRRFPDFTIEADRWTHNYERLFNDGNWLISLQNVLTLAILFGFVFAAMVEREQHGEGFFRTVFLYPLAVSLIVTGIVWRWMFNPSLGIENFLHGLGWESANFTGSPTAGRLCTASSWRRSGMASGSKWR